MSKKFDESSIRRSDQGEGFRFSLKQLFQPEAVLLWLAVVYCLFEFVSAMQEKDNPFIVSPWIFVGGSMVFPLLMLIASALIMTNRLPTTAFAMIVAGYLFYVTGFRGMVSIPNSHGVPMFSLDAVKIWFNAMPSNLIFQAVFATCVLIIGTVQLVRLIRANQTAV